MSACLELVAMEESAGDFSLDSSKKCLFAFLVVFNQVLEEQITDDALVIT